ncbi:MAG: hypothetical protein LC667_19255, partial [Thioalkalivibrio sp.]|nr:hypothetical protein [Thioalkalivibrio sp.]
RAMSETVGKYLDFAMNVPGLQYQRFLRELFVLTRHLAAPLFTRTIERALHYRIVEIPTLRRIAVLSLDCDAPPLPLPIVDENYCQRDSYVEGALTDAPDLSRYDQILEDADG